MKKLILTVVLGWTAGVVLAEPVIENIQVRQQWPWSTDVTIDFDVAGADPATPKDVAVTVYNGSTRVDGISPQAFTGARYSITQDGRRRIVFDPTKSGLTNHRLDRFNVELTLVDSTADSEILYKIFDLDSRTVTDVSRAELLNGDYGTVETNFTFVGSTTLTDVLIWTGVTNDVVYKTSKMVFRKIPAGTFLMGSPTSESGRTPAREGQHEVTLTRDYYMGVFKVTHAQWLRLRSTPPRVSDAKQASANADYANEELMTSYANYMTYFSLRGTYTEDPTTGAWPTCGNRVASDSFIGLARAWQPLCGYEIDLPTEAQWEYACRAGTTSAYYDGSNGGSMPAAINYIGGEVGSTRPNAYGLYDVLSSLTGEYVLDYSSETYGATTAGEAATDPKGGTADGSFPSWPRILRGSNSRSAGRNFVKAYYWNPAYGVRLALQPEGWAEGGVEGSV